MLKLREITKYYMDGKNKKTVLDKVSIDFKRGELVFILGASGSGKSTLLNIIAGNLRCNTGEILLDGEDICKFKDSQLDNYHKNMIGYIYQDYNLIEYLSVYDNIMLGCPQDNKEQNINVLLNQLSIFDKKNSLVKTLSGGEKQRVAIARAMIKNPEIILCDEPTGALDTPNSKSIMEILKKISKNKLVIVVSHDENLANEYSDRIIQVKDGHIEYLPIEDNKLFGSVPKSKLKMQRIFKIALKNLFMKRGRTITTSLALSLGIISMSLVICLGNNFNKEINELERNVVGLFPIKVTNGETLINDQEDRSSSQKIIRKNISNYKHTNKIDLKYLKYLSDIKEISYLRYNYNVSIPFISDKFNKIDNNYLEMIMDKDFILNNYNILSGNNINNMFDILLVVDNNNNVPSELLDCFKIEHDISYNEIIGRKIKVILNDDYYQENGPYYYINQDNSKLYEKSNIELTIVGVVKEKELINNKSTLIYSNQLLQMLLDINRNSDIVKSQRINDYNVLGINLSKEEMLNYLGYNSLPNEVLIYTQNIQNKKIVLNKLDNYNKEAGDNYLEYVDMIENTLNIVRDFIKIVTAILLLFSIISLIISLMMIGILTNVRILERKKEIGIFRSLGASKKNIRQLFNIENMFQGLLAGIISLGVLKIFEDPINKIIYKIVNIDDIFKLDYIVFIIIIFTNLLLIKFVSSPALRKASKMEITKCIYDR